MILTKISFLIDNSKLYILKANIKEDYYFIHSGNILNKVASVNLLSINLFIIYIYLFIFGGDWGLGIGDCGIGDWAQSQIPTPQSPIPNPH